MTPAFVFDALRKRAWTFRDAKRGNVMLTFALATIPMVGFVGAAVDYSRGNSAKAAMQQAIDATGLILSKDASTTQQSALNDKATALFTTLINRPEITNIVVTPVLSNPTEGSFMLDVSATGKVNTTFTKIFGKESLDLSVNTQIKWGMKKLELALALDNTGSMASSNKMTELKKALLAIKGQNGATEDGLLEVLKKAAKKAGDVKVSVIPFDTTVKVGTAFKNETWVDWDEAFGSCSKSLSNPKTKTRCQNIGGTWNKDTNKNNWGGCVIDREKTGDHDGLDSTPDGSAAKNFPATKQCGNIVEALPLTDIWDSGYQTLKDKINAMQPNGNTNVTIGLAWGWHSLTTATPFTQGAAPVTDLEKVIILLTDGDNTQNRWSTSQSSIDTRTQTACTNVKAPGVNIKLYTIRVIEGNETLLKNCATKTTMYYNVTQAAQLNPVFAAIAQDLANLRIAK